MTPPQFVVAACVKRIANRPRVAAATHDFLLWIQDLSRLDEIVRLPLCMPLFGCHLNFLPFLTTGIVRGRIRR
jgi:hypothetical protein